MVPQQDILNVPFSASEDPRKGIDRLETKIRQYHSTTKKKIDDDTRTGVLLRALANGSELHNNVGDHVVLNTYQFLK